MRPGSVVNALSRAGIIGLAMAVAITIGQKLISLTDRTPTRAEVTRCAQLVADDLKNSTAMADFVKAAADERQPKDFLTALCGDGKDCNKK